MPVGSTAHPPGLARTPPPSRPPSTPGSTEPRPPQTARTLCHHPRQSSDPQWGPHYPIIYPRTPRGPRLGGQRDGDCRGTVTQQTFLGHRAGPQPAHGSRVAQQVACACTWLAPAPTPAAICVHLSSLGLAATPQQPAHRPPPPPLLAHSPLRTALPRRSTQRAQGTAVGRASESCTGDGEQGTRCCPRPLRAGPSAKCSPLA